MKTGLELTFAHLAATSNEAADALLDLALESNNAQVRSLAMQSILTRGHTLGVRRILQLWTDLNDDQLRLTQDFPQLFRRPIELTLAGEIKDIPRENALEALRLLSLDELLPLLIDYLETNEDRSLRATMLAVVLDLAAAIGDSARRGRERPSIREPIIRRLADSVKSCFKHGCEGLNEAFLVASSWGDRELRMLLTEDPSTIRRLHKCLQTSSLPGVIQLLAGFIRRRDIPLLAQNVISQREDAAFRDALLSAVGDDPPRIALRNLQQLPQLPCIADPAAIVGKTPSVHHAALVHTFTANYRVAIAQLNVILDVIARGNPHAENAAAISLERAERIDSLAMIQAAVSITSGNLQAIADNPVAQVVWRMVQALDHPNPHIVGALRNVLSPLQAASMMEHLDFIEQPPTPSLGGLVRRIDPSLIATLQEELRSPVMVRRLRALRLTAICEVVDSLTDLLIHAALHDHRDIRMLAIAALGSATDEKSLAVLEDLAVGPPCALRDTSRDAINNRRTRADTITVPLVTAQSPPGMLNSEWTLSPEATS